MVSTSIKYEKINACNISTFKNINGFHLHTMSLENIIFIAILITIKLHFGPV
jgi:hypothetical protein